MELIFLVNDDASQNEMVMVDDQAWEEFSSLCSQRGYTPTGVIEQFFVWSATLHDAGVAWVRVAVERDL